MRRAMRITAWVSGALIVLPALAVVALLLGANTDGGRRLIESAVRELSGGRVVVTGLAGHFPDDLTLAHAEIADAQGAWLVADGLTLQWSPSRLIDRHVQIQLLGADRVQLQRRPESGSGGESHEPSGRLDLDRVDIRRLDLGQPIAGAPASLSLQGAAHVASLRDLELDLTAARIDAPGSYRLAGRVDGSVLTADIAADEPAGGLLSGLAKLPDLGALSLRLAIDGPRNAEATRFTLSAGALRAEGKGLVDLDAKTVDIDLTASSPAMAPRPDLRWKSASLQAHVRGPFSGPGADGELRVEALAAGETRLRSVRADVRGDRAAVTLRATLEGLRVPGPQPTAFESAPVELTAELRLDDPERPVTFAVSHPLLSLQGRGQAAGELRGSASVTVPSLAPLAAIAGVDLKGRARLDAELARHGATTDVRVRGTVALTGGEAPLPALVGNAATIALAATLQADEITLTQIQLDGKSLQLSARGASRRDALDLDWRVALPDLGMLAPQISGRIEAQGRVRGAAPSLEVTADATGELATHGFPRGPVKAAVRLRGLAAAPTGNIEATATLDGSPLALALTLERAGNAALHATIQRADWKSAHAEGEVTVRSADRAPQGRVSFRIAQLGDLEPWIGGPVEGGLSGRIDFTSADGRAQARVDVEGRELAARGGRISRAALIGTLADPTHQPKLALQLVADGIAAYGMTGSAQLQVNGPQDALKLALTSDLHHAMYGDVPLAASATLDAPQRQLTLATLQSRYRGESVQLLAPARFSLRDGVAVDRLRLGVQQAVLEVAGRVAPTLDLTASLRNAAPALARAVDEDLQADGTLTMDARLTGTLAGPHGSVKLAASGLRMRTGSARSLPPANIAATAELDGSSAQLDVKITAGSQVGLDATGSVPLSASGALNLHARGTLDAAIANPLLEVNGRRVKGRMAVDLAASGTYAAPRVEGSLRLSDGELQDYALGTQLTKIEGVIDAAGDSIRITSLTAQAGTGSVSASGTIGVFVPGRPVELKVAARGAKLFATDLLTADLDADVTLRGQAQARLDAAGTITVHRAQITIPKALPPTVAVLDVRKPGQKPPAPSAPGLVVGLDLDVSAPRGVFVRGRGLDVETGGDLKLRGTSAAPQVGGGFDLRRGSFDLGSATLQFTSGRVSFAGTGLSQKIDPTLDFLAQSTSNGITATLAVTGYADAPRIALSSIPDLPQDEILSRLLFGVSAKQLTPLQLAQIAAAIAAIAGVSGDHNPLTAIQKGLGLDRLSAGSTATGGTTVEAGRYVSERVYVGAKQNTQGGTQAQVQVDLTKNLKLQATLGMGGTVPVQGTTPENDPGSSVGLSYQFEY